MSKMLTCRDVADYFLSLQDEESGDTISNLKLQKLVYYAQGFSLAIYDRQLFGEHIEAWIHGPVIPDLYRQFNEHGSKSIPVQAIDLEKFNDDAKSLLDEVYSVYGQYSGWKLRNMTHEEPPWKDSPVHHTSAWRYYFITQTDKSTSQAKQGIISHESMREYFKTLISG